MKEKVPVVSDAEPEEVARLADLPLDETVTLADVAAPSTTACSALCRRRRWR